jgi:hypothetical protein
MPQRVNQKKKNKGAIKFCIIKVGWHLKLIKDKVYVFKDNQTV